MATRTASKSKQNKADRAVRAPRSTPAKARPERPKPKPVTEQARGFAPDDRPRCGWSYGGMSREYVDYHDSEWGVPVRDDRKLFEFLVLEGAQAGLSWSTILRKRPGYREAFADFDVERVARFDARKVERLLRFDGIVRNRLKIQSAITNARCFLKVQDEFGSFADYSWAFVGGRPIVNAWTDMGEIPATSPVSDAFSKDLQKRGFKFVGSTIIYAHMQATGMVNDHVVSCFRHDQC